MVKFWTIYKIISPKGRIYIGITSRLKSRMEAYRNCDKRLYKQTLIYNSIRKYGYNNHIIEIVEEFEATQLYAQGKEMFWIRTYMSNKNKYPEQNGLNLTDGGDGTLGYKPSAEAIEKNRQSKLGKKQSPATIKKRADAQRGKKMNFTHITEEFKRMLSERNKQYRHTEEAKKKIGEASKGNKYRLGYKMTIEQIENRSSKIRGTKRNPEAAKRSRDNFVEKHGTKVIQYSLNNEFIKEYPSVIDAAKELNIPKLGIFRNISGKHQQSRGFIFKRKIECQ